MVAETARKFEALEAQALQLLALFTSSGYEAVAPAIIQPADVFLDVVGESLRARTYVFTDPDGQELCLRPDLTVPTCRLYLERHAKANVAARYCYNGPAFRFQPAGASAVHPREYRQAGIESFADTDREKADTEVMALIARALRAAGLERFNLRMGDLGLFHALLEALAIPQRWRERLRHHFWRPEAFRSELRRLTSNPAEALEDLPADLIAALDPDNVGRAEALVDRYLEQNRLELIGARAVREIAASLLATLADARAEPLSQASADVIETYLRLDVPAPVATAQLEGLMSKCGFDLGRALETFHRRLQLLAAAGLDPGQVQFQAEFGRNLEYYTGFVFEVTVPGLGPHSPIAGGGRYDGLLRAVGAPVDVPAVGAMIHTERLLAAANGARA